MSTHVPGATYVAIHSVCVSEEHRRKGVASRLLREYVERLEKLRREANEDLKGARLITHEELRGLYEGAGFRWIGESEVVHGERKWWEMGIDFDSVEGGTKELVVSGDKEKEEETELLTLVDQNGSNAVDLYCPREGCRSIILKAGVAKWALHSGKDLIVRSPFNSNLTHPFVALGLVTNDN